LTCANVTIAGYTAPGAATNTLSVGENAVLEVVLDGTTLGGGDGLTIEGTGDAVEGLDIVDRYTNGIHILPPPPGGSLPAAGGRAGLVTVSGCFIGVKTDGETSGINGTGILIDNSPSNMIGATDPVNRNVISANLVAGVAIKKINQQTNGSPNNNTIAGNYINTDAQGTHAMGVQGRGGVLLDSSAGAAATVVSGNTISGGVGPGIFVGQGGTSITANFIGVDASGSFALGNQGDGIDVQAANVTIGGSGSAPRNVISANGAGQSGGYGIVVGIPESQTSIQGALIAGNYIGVDPTGTKAKDGNGTSFGNATGGVLVTGGSGNSIGGATTRRGIGPGNLISNNGGANGYGVLLQQLTQAAACANNVVQGNLIGTDATGSVALGNGNGVYIENASQNTIGGTAVNVGNIVSGNGTGVVITAGAGRNQVAGNIIDLDVSGGHTLPNTGNGILLSSGASNNTIGSTPSSGPSNVISANGNNGIYLHDTSSPVVNNLIEGNYIGTDIGGNLAKDPNQQTFGNGGDGIFLDFCANSNTVGGTTGGARNIISNNDKNGVELGGKTNVIAGNYIGTDLTGMSGLGNLQDGVRQSNGDANTIGGTSSASGNVISANAWYGIEVDTGGLWVGWDIIGYKKNGTDLLINTSGGISGSYTDGGDNTIQPP